MLARLNSKFLALQAALAAGALTGAATPAAANDFSTLSENVIRSIESVPGLLSGIAYLIGLLLGVLGILKLKDHVENPSNAPLKDGAIRLAAGGALFALPFIYEAMRVTIGDTATITQAPVLSKVELGLN